MATPSMLLQEGIAFTSADSSSLKRKRPPMIEIPHVLQQVQPHKLFDFKPLKEDEHVSFSGYGYGVFSVKGNKRFMEDAHKVVPSLGGTSKKVSHAKLKQAFYLLIYSVIVHFLSQFTYVANM